MAKGKYNGIVVGGAPWELPREGKETLRGFSYKVLTLDGYDEKTKLHESVGIVSVGTESKQFDPAIKYGDKVEFEGEFREGFNGAKGKMQYSNLRVIKGDK